MSEMSRETYGGRNFCGKNCTRRERSGGMSGSPCRITSLRAAVMICGTLVNTQTDSFESVILLAQPAEVKTGCELRLRVFT